jgi:TP901 family phage tail tape measure protein
MSATFNAARTQIVALAGDTKKTTGAFESFFNELKGNFKSVSAYLISSFSIQEVWQQIRKGITYVREIDTALTELKKVTDETDESYNQFLQDMSKTGSVIGATVSDLTTMASEWARLGYSLEEAGKLAESTAILLNVSEFKDATTASEALISTMQAFQYTADESQHVVDILNEVGKFIARR